MRILFLTSAHNSLSQRLLIELTERGHDIRVSVVATGHAMIDAVSHDAPDLIVAPMLKIAIPDAVSSHHLCLIVHPGIKGDRGSSSLDWAIANDEKSWGVSILEAAHEFDAGPIWASHEFPLEADPLAKSSLYRGPVTEAAVRGVLEVVSRVETGEFKSGSWRPEKLSDALSSARGCLRPSMKQADRAINWSRDKTASIVRKVRAADSAPGVLDSIFGRAFFLYGGHYEDRLKGSPGRLLAQRDGAICRATVDGAVWITHLKAKDEDGPGIKLPATKALGTHANSLPNSVLPVVAEIDYRTFREIRYVEREGVGYIYFDFYNGAMSTEQCYRLRDAFLFARSQPTRVIVLLGGQDFFSNGIHLNVIEAADDPALESWRNINAIDDLIHEIINTMSHIVIAGMRGNAGAGGAMLALAADHVYARKGVVLNPHYKGMGGLYGSEYWTYTLPKRVGRMRATALTDNCRPVGTNEAKSIGFIDDCFGGDVNEFERLLGERAKQFSQRTDFWLLLREKHQRRMDDERAKPLASYRKEELRFMHLNFFGSDASYHLARQTFVYKGRPPERRVEKIRDLVGV